MRETSNEAAAGVSMLVLAIVGLLTSLLWACGDDNSAAPNLPEGSLHAVYANGNTSALIDILDAWANSSIPASTMERSGFDLPTRSLYEIFEDFYNPFRIERYGDFEVGPIYGAVRYMLVQHTMRMRTSEGEIELDGFRPRVSLPGARTIYLTEEREAELAEFLAEDLPWEKLRQRHEFLAHAILVIPGHWFGWHYLTHPEVFTVDFTVEPDRAVIDFRIVYQGGQARYERTPEGWVFQESHSTWIE